VLVVFVGACLYNIPRFFERVVVLQPYCAGGQPRPQSSWTSLRNNPIYFLIYKTIFYFIFRSVGPLVALIALNSRLAVELRNVDERRTALRGRSAAVAVATSKSARLRGGGEKQHENLTAMLVGVVTVFIVCQLPGLAIRIAYTVSEFARASSTVVQLDVPTLRYANIASNALLVFNSAVNIVVYCLVGKRFRRILLDEMLSCSSCPCRPTSSANSSRPTAGVMTVSVSHIQ